MKLIDKYALVAEIEKIRAKWFGINNDFAHGQKGALTDVLSLIDTLEVKEVDLEKEIQNHIKECLDVKFPTTNIELIKKDVAYTAKKFFELGIRASNKTQKGELVW